MARWIYCFREGERRELTALECREFARLYRTKRALSILQGLGAALFVVPLVGGIASVPDHPGWGWLAIILSVVFGLWAYAGAKDRDTLALLYRRAARLGKATSWHRDEAPLDVRAGTWMPTFREPREEELEEWVNSSYWLDDERFDRSLEKAVGKPVRTFETVDLDAVILTIEGKRVQRIIETRIWDPARHLQDPAHRPVFEKPKPRA